MRKAIWVSMLLVVLALFLAACGPARPPTPAPAPGKGGETFMLALPRLVVDIDPNGNPIIFGLNAGDVGRFLGADLSSIRVDPSTVKLMTASNVQNVEMRQVGDALSLYVNGKPMPHIGWSDASLQQATDVAALFGVKNTDLYRRLLPLVRRLGVDVALRFPRQPNATEIPLADPNQNVALAPTTDLPSAIVRMDVKYDDQGRPSVMGLTEDDLRALGVQNAPGRLSPDLIAKLQDRNIQTLELRAKNDGMYVYKNGEVLPNLVWDNTLLKNATDLWTQTHPNDPNLPIIQLIGPWLDKADVDVLFHFPIKAGTAALPVQMHE